jgi:hypothetical protein
MTFCSQCGNELSEGVAFCIGCRAKAEGNPAAEIATTEPKVTIAEGTPMGRANCQYCNGVGTVLAEQVKKKKGVSPGKVAGALTTGGISLLATDLAKP